MFTFLQSRRSLQLSCCWFTFSDVTETVVLCVTAIAPAEFIIVLFWILLCSSLWAKQHTKKILRMRLLKVWNNNEISYLPNLWDYKTHFKIRIRRKHSYSLSTHFYAKVYCDRFAVWSSKIFHRNVCNIIRFSLWIFCNFY